MPTPVRTLLYFLICTIGCWAQSPADQVLAVYRQREKAEQAGDIDAWVGLHSREAAPFIEKIRSYSRPGQTPPAPDKHYTSSRVFVQGDEAVVLGRVDGGRLNLSQFLRMRFVKEDGSWKIRDQSGRNTAFHPDSVYAWIPPASGAFERAGAPWRNVAPALTAADAVERGWQVRATRDESFLYIRIESPTPLPAPDSPGEAPRERWPVMKALVPGIGEFVLVGGATTGVHGGAIEEHFVAYSFRLERAEQEIFTVFAPDPLIRVGERFFDLRIPLRTMGITDARRTRIALSTAQRPAIFSFPVHRYPVGN